MMRRSPKPVSETIVLAVENRVSHVLPGSLRRLPKDHPPYNAMRVGGDLCDFWRPILLLAAAFLP
jgi:hypothetical protein